MENLTKESLEGKNSDMLKLTRIIKYKEIYNVCTTMIITKGATVDGSMIVTHSDDNDELANQRIVYVPAQDHPAGAMRQVFKELYRYPL
jgi:hypothetical protein